MRKRADKRSHGAGINLISESTDRKIGRFHSEDLHKTIDNSRKCVRAKSTKGPIIDSGPRLSAAQS